MVVKYNQENVPVPVPVLSNTINFEKGVRYICCMTKQSCPFLGSEYAMKGVFSQNISLHSFLDGLSLFFLYISTGQTCHNATKTGHHATKIGHHATKTGHDYRIGFQRRLARMPR